MGHVVIIAPATDEGDIAEMTDERAGFDAGGFYFRREDGTKAYVGTLKRPEASCSSAEGPLPSSF